MPNSPHFGRAGEAPVITILAKNTEAKMNAFFADFAALLLWQGSEAPAVWRPSEIPQAQYFGPLGGQVFLSNVLQSFYEIELFPF